MSVRNAHPEWRKAHRAELPALAKLSTKLSRRTVVAFFAENPTRRFVVLPAKQFGAPRCWACHKSRFGETREWARDWTSTWARSDEIAIIRRLVRVPARLVEQALCEPLNEPTSEVLFNYAAHQSAAYTCEGEYDEFLLEAHFVGDE